MDLEAEDATLEAHLHSGSCPTRCWLVIIGRLGTVGRSFTRSRIAREDNSGVKNSLCLLLEIIRSLEGKEHGEVSVTCPRKVGTKEGQENPKTPKFGEAVVGVVNRNEARALSNFHDETNASSKTRNIGGLRAAMIGKKRFCGNTGLAPRFRQVERWW